MSNIFVYSLWLSITAVALLAYVARRRKRNSFTPVAKRTPGIMEGPMKENTGS